MLLRLFLKKSHKNNIIIKTKCKPVLLTRYANFEPKYNKYTTKWLPQLRTSRRIQFSLKYCLNNSVPCNNSCKVALPKLKIRPKRWKNFFIKKELNSFRPREGGGATSFNEAGRGERAFKAFAHFEGFKTLMASKQCKSKFSDFS